jgi:hypothetical protein
MNIPIVIHIKKQTHLFISTYSIDTSRICLSAHKTIEAGNENRLFTMDYIARLDFMLLFCVHSSKFGKCLLNKFSVAMILQIDSIALQSISDEMSLKP